MKRSIIACILTLSIGVFSSCSGSSEEKESEDKSEETTENSTSVEEETDETTEEVKDQLFYSSKKGENGLFGFVDDDNNWVLEPQFERVNFDMRYDLAAVRNNDWKWGYVNKEGEMVVPYQYRFAGDFTDDGTAPVKVETGGKKWIYIDRKGNTVLELTDYDQCRGFWNGIAAVSINGEGTGFINKEGELVIPVKYDHIQGTIHEDGTGTYFEKNGVTMASYKDSEKVGLLAEDGSELTEFKYDWMPVYASEHGIIVTKIDEKYGAINEEGEEILPVEYDKVSITNLSDDIKVEKDGKEMHFSFDGECLEGC